MRLIEPYMFSECEMRGYWPFSGLEGKRYDLIMADPPWHFQTYSPKGEGKSPQKHYTTMTLADIRRLPVAAIAADDCLLWLWATAPMLNAQLEVIASWGFEFKSSGAWVKTTVHGKISFGTGYLLRNCHEPFLIATRGNPKTTRATRSVVMGLARAHSQKPEEAYAAAEKLIPEARRIELFSRTSRENWDAWGHEAGKFDQATD